MLVRCRTALLVAAILLLALPGACSKRDLEITGTASLGGFSGTMGPGGASGTAGSTASGTAGTGGHLPPADAGTSPCVGTTVLLPWMESTSTGAMRLDVATSNSAIAVMNRQATLLDVRTYGRDGHVIGGFQFASDAQFLSSRDDRFLLVQRGQSGDLVATAIDPDLVGSTRLFAAASNATERLFTAIALPTTVIALTSEHFVNLATGKTVPWSSVIPGFGPAMGPFLTSLPYGLATDGNRVLMIWGEQSNLLVALIDASGTLIALEQDLNFLSYPGTPPTAIPYDSGLLLFDGSSVRATKVGFDLTRTVLGTNTQLRAFYRSTPRVAAIVLQGHPVAFWLTVFPATDNTQGSTVHQLYGCQLDLANPASCLSTAPIASTGFSGYGIGQEPVAAAALPDGSGFAIAHTDSDGYSWLNVADLSCADARPAP